MGRRTRPHAYLLNQKRAAMLNLVSHLIPFKIIARNRKTSKTAVYRYFHRLQEKGYITKQKELTATGKHLIQKFLVVSHDVKLQKIKPDLLRLHDLQFSIKLIHRPRDWNKRRQTIASIKVRNYQHWKIRNSLITEFFIDKCRIRTTTRSILVTPSDVYGGSAREVKNRALDILSRVIPKIEALFSITLSRDMYLNIKVSRQHNALIFNEIAKQFIEAGLPLRIFNEAGELILIVDDSEGLKELEAVHKITSEEDAERVKNLLRDVVLNDPLLPSQLSKKINHLEAGLDKKVDTLIAMVRGGPTVQQLASMVVVSNEKISKALEALNQSIKKLKGEKK